MGRESRNAGRLLAEEALRLPAQKERISGMFGGSKLCHCEIGTARIRKKPLMEEDYKLPQSVVIGTWQILEEKSQDLQVIWGVLVSRAPSSKAVKGLSCMVAGKENRCFYSI